jgi:hypothetical protein
MQRGSRKSGVEEPEGRGKSQGIQFTYTGKVYKYSIKVYKYIIKVQYISI